MRKQKFTKGANADEPFRLLVASVSDYAIFMLDPEGHVLSWNAGAERIKGYSADEIIGQHFSRFYPAEDKATKPKWELQQAVTQGKVEEEGWRIRKDGTHFWALVVITAMRDAKGKLIGFAKVTRDLTERKAAEEQLRASEEQFRKLVESVEEYAIYMLDPNGNVASWNSGAEKIKQYSAKEIIGKNFACFYTPQDIAAGRPQRNLEEARRHGHTRDDGLRVRKDGSTFPAEVVLTIVRDDSGEVRGFSKVTRDVTDQLRTREMEAARMAAEKANQAKDDFLAAVSHELRTPLTPALAAASYLASNADKIPHEFNTEVGTIRRNIQLEARLIDDLLDLTRVARGKIELRFDRVDAHAIIRDSLDIAQGDIEEKRLNVLTDLQAEKRQIWADPIRIQQVFWNVINNAVKFTPAGGQIEIRTSNDNHQHFKMEVIDNGIGIEQGQQASLFKPFTQAGPAVTRQFGGLGLGLAISKQLIDLHDGEISVYSRGAGCGATFNITLDTVPSQVGQTGVTARTPHKPVKSLRILLVEDHGDTRRTLSRLLSHFGHDISVADCTQTALEIVESKEFDVVLSDIGLPDGSGYDVISQAKRKRPVKGVALTGYGTDEDVRRGKEAGFDFHLTKPVDFHELRSVLEQVGQ
jgi:PAS domain S-box-containing protein